MDADQIFRIAIVGCGPRGLYCLIELERQLRVVPHFLKVEVLIFEPAPYPGAGSVYDSDQPPYLRMNFAAKHIDAYRKDAKRDPADFDFVTWANREPDSHLGTEDYAPRAFVGKYLHAMFERLLYKFTLTEGVVVHLIQEKINSIASCRGRWQLCSLSGKHNADELLITTGHEGWRGSASARGRDASTFVFPTNVQLGLGNVPPHSAVTVKGFGLTAIDSALALTEGRGGKFIFEQQRCTYVASGEEPTNITMQSRTGRPMFAKPIEPAMKLPAGLGDIWKDGNDAIQALERPIEAAEVKQQITRVILETASRALAAHPRAGLTMDQATDRLHQWYSQWQKSFPEESTVIQLMRHSVEVANGRAAPDAAWALGEAWRKLYLALVEVVSHGGLAEQAWPAWRLLAVEMERIAFGPPAENMSRMLALADAGLLNCRRSSSAVRNESPSHVPRAVTIHAVIAAPNEWEAGGPVACLLASGLAKTLAGAGGIEVDAAGTPSHDGADSVGLAILGRATEGSILGNDTLSRELHAHPQAWAKRVVDRLTSLQRGHAHAS